MWIGGIEFWQDAASANSNQRANCANGVLRVLIFAGPSGILLPFSTPYRIGMIVPRGVV